MAYVFAYRVKHIAGGAPPKGLKTSCLTHAPESMFQGVNKKIADYVGDGYGQGDMAIVCPSCRSLAVFTSPYVILSGAAAVTAVGDSQIRGVPFHDGFAVERFPDLFPWNDPKNRIIHHDGPFENWGVVSCAHCPLRKKYRLRWPQDAFYKLDSPCGVLWAETREQLVHIRESIADPQRRGWMFANRLNKSFFLKRNRDRILRGIDEVLEKHTSAEK